jgi:hypothetical protein
MIDFYNGAVNLREILFKNRDGISFLSNQTLPIGLNTPVKVPAPNQR